jgi:hypothetical protein
MNCRTPKSRPAAVLAQRLIYPGVLDEGLRSGLFLAQDPKSVRWEPFARELIVELKALGAVVLSVDLARIDTAPAKAIRQAVLDEAFRLATVGQHSDADVPSTCPVSTLSALVERLVQIGRRDVVLICDALSRLSSSSEIQLPMALKAARDRLNLRSEATGRFIFVATDPDEAVLRRYVMDAEQAFFGATLEALPPA